MCVPASNYDKDTMTFKNRDQLVRESLMMSEVTEKNDNQRQRGSSVVSSNRNAAGGYISQRSDAIRSLVLLKGVAIDVGSSVQKRSYRPS